MGFFSNLGSNVSKVAATPAKQSTKTTSITSIISGVAAAVKTVASTVAGAVKGVADVIKKKQAAETKAKSNNRNTSSSTNTQTSSSGSGSNSSSSPTSNSSNILLEWNGHQFYVTPTKVVGYKSLQITASCETEDETNGGNKYVKKKNDGGYEVKFTAILDKRLGVSDVRAIAMHLAEDARTGAKSYVYNNGSKLFTPQMMGTGATVKNIVTAPNGTWISAEVDMTLKQCSKGDGSSSPESPSSGGGGGGYKYSVTVYYSGSSGAVSSVTGYSNVSKDDARKKAWAKVPGNAQWASETKSQASNQTQGRTDAKNSANQTTESAKDASSYVQKKVDSIKPSQTGGTTNKVTPATKPVALVK